VNAEPFAIHKVPLPGEGAIGLSRLPGRSGALAADVAMIIGWRPAIVVSLAERAELAAHGAESIGEALRAQRIAHRHFPVPDYGVPSADDTAWPPLAADLHAALDTGRRVLLHCMGGCGRSGMIALRLLTERGEAAKAALARLREIRPCAVETDRQFAWAAGSASRRT
jgi:predicted protein tyrosine phosphatase